MVAKNTIHKQRPHETGTQLHQRETRRQIYLPYGLGILLIVLMLSIVALPSNPVWRIRAQAIADWTYTILCLAPLVMCAFATFMVVALGIWGMNRAQSSSEPPLRKLENLATRLAAQIENASNYVNRKTIDVSASIEPMMDFFSAFDVPESTGEETADDTTEQHPT